jgi:hypothetical protein
MNRGRHKKSNRHLIVQILGKNIANRMMEYQKEQGNIPNLDVFLRRPDAGKFDRGFTWSDTKEGHWYWYNIIIGTLKEHPLYKQYKNGRS